jgi:hypothetical protein
VGEEGMMGPAAAAEEGLVDQAAAAEEEGMMGQAAAAELVEAAAGAVAGALLSNTAVGVGTGVRVRIIQRPCLEICNRNTSEEVTGAKALRAAAGVGVHRGGVVGAVVDLVAAMTVVAGTMVVGVGVILTVVAGLQRMGDPAEEGAQQDVEEVEVLAAAAEAGAEAIVDRQFLSLSDPGPVKHTEYCRSFPYQTVE